MACNKKIAMDAYDELLGGLDRAEELQLETLEKILREQQNTLFGRTHGFSQIKSPEDYRSRVPLSEYGDYADAVRRMLNGEDDLIMSGKPFAYLLSSGSSGRPKLIPISEEETRLHESVNNCIPEIARRYYERRGDDPDGVFGKTFHIDENIITRSPGGCLTTVTTSVPYYRTKTRGLLDFEQYTAPEEVLFPNDFTNLTYVKLRFALQERDVRRIVSVYARRLVSVFRFFEANRDTILRDIELGTVDASWELPEKWRTLVESCLPADPERARELRSISKPLRLKDIWPGLRYIVGIDGDTFPQIHTSLAALCEGVPFHNYIYGSSESFMAIATGMEELGEYTLMPTAGFFEFLPEHAGADAKPLLCSQLEVGGRYEIIVTNFSGLYRYRMQDILQVVRFEGTSPVLKMCYRINQIIDVAGEQFSSEELDAALAQFIESTGLSCSGCCITDDYSVDPPRYAVYMEAGSDNSHGPLADILEDIFCRVQWGYACARRGNELSPLRLCLVPEGTFDRFEKLHGGDLNQYKPPKALLTSEQKAFFAQFDYPER